MRRPKTARDNPHEKQTLCCTSYGCNVRTGGSRSPGPRDMRPPVCCVAVAGSLSSVWGEGKYRSEPRFHGERGKTMHRTTCRVVNVMSLVLAVVFSVAVAVEAQESPPAPGIPPARESEAATAAQQTIQTQQQLITNPQVATTAAYILTQSECSLCFTCGGAWPIFAGSWPVAAPTNPTERGSACAEPLMARPDSRPFLCCTDNSDP